MQVNFRKMNEYSTEIYNQIIETFPDLEGQNESNNNLLKFHLENEYKSTFGDLYIETSEDDKIWVRANFPFTTYEVDSTEELFYILEGLMYNELFWVISYEGEDWDDTFLILKDQEIKIEEGITYHILSWNGKNDQTIKP